MNVLHGHMIEALEHKSVLLLAALLDMCIRNCRFSVMKSDPINKPSMPSLHRGMKSTVYVQESLFILSK